MDQSPTLQKLLLNIIYEVTAPNKTDKLDAYQMIGLLALTNLRLSTCSTSTLTTASICPLPLIHPGPRATC